MSKKVILRLAVVFLVLISSEAILSQNVVFGVNADPTKLKVYVGPTSIPADNKIYDCIAVQLQDSRSNPARAKQDVVISLSSSLITLGDVVNPTITIPKGSTYATAQFQTTFTPGTTSITATASGYTTVQAPVTTVRSTPSAIVVYGYPSTLPADSKTYEGTVIVQLQDSSGAPAVAPNEGLRVDLSSSNTMIGIVEPYVTIEGGKNYAATTFTTTMTPGTVTITPIAAGYTCKQATYTTQTVNPTPAALKIYLGPPKVFADKNTYRQVAIAIQSTSGTVAQATSDITVTLASSDPEVGTIDQTITILASEYYAIANFDTTYKSGTTTVTATATDLKTAQATVTTIGSSPTKLAVYAIPPALPADSQSYSVLQVQLQDSSGKPAKDPDSDVVVSLFSSTPDGGDVASQQLTIPFGETGTQGVFISTYSANSTTVTAQASNYATGQVRITTYLIDQFSLNVSLTPGSKMVYPGKNSTIVAYVTYEGKQPASGIKLTINSTKGGNFTTPKYEGNGTYTTVFTAPKSSGTTVSNIIANVTKTGYTSAVGNNTITVSTSANVDPLSTGTLLVRTNENDNTNPVSGAQMTTTAMPAGASPLMGITNGSGYMVFSYVPAGSYGLLLTKEGYENQTKFVTVMAGQTVTCNVLLSQTASSWPIVIVVIVAAVVAGVVGFIFLRRRRMQKRLAQRDTLTLA